MNPQQRIQRFFHTPSITESATIQDIRVSILEKTLFLATSIGTFFYLVTLINAFQHKQSLVWTFLYSLLYLILITTTFFSRLNFFTRALGFIITVYLTGVITAILPGGFNNAMIWMAGCVILTALFLGGRAGLIVLLIAIATLLVSTSLPSTISYLPSQESNAINPAAGGLPILTFSAVLFLTIGGTALLIQALEKHLTTQFDQVQHLEKQQALLSLSSQDLAKRIIQVRTAAEISRIISSLLDPDVLLQKVVDLVKDRFKLYYVGVFMVDETNEYAVLRAGSGEAGKAMLSEGHKLAIGGTSMIGWAVANGKARIALDTGKEATRFANPHLPLTRSELALPLNLADKTIGALTVQSELPEAFDENDIAVLQGIGDTLSTALENARLFKQLQESLKEIQNLHRQYLTAAWSDVTQKEPALAHTYSDDSQSSSTHHAYEFPIQLRNQIIGSITLETDATRWTPENEYFAQAIATQTALALENARLLEETRRMAHQEKLVSNVATRIRETLDVESVLRTAVDELYRSLNMREVTIRLFDDSNEEENARLSRPLESSRKILDE